MATLTASAAYSGIQPRAALGVNSVEGRISVTSVTANDVLQMVKIPKGANILDVKVSGAADSGGIVGAVTVGDGNDADRYITTTSASAAVPIIGMNSAAGGLGYEYSADDTIDITMASVSVGSGTATILVCSVLYTMDP